MCLSCLSSTRAHSKMWESDGGSGRPPPSSTSGYESVVWAVLKTRAHQTNARTRYCGLQPADSCRSRTELAGVGDRWYRRRFLAVRNGGKS